jgi:hypothetical protein
MFGMLAVSFWPVFAWGSTVIVFGVTFWLV